MKRLGLLMLAFVGISSSNLLGAAAGRGDGGVDDQLTRVIDKLQSAMFDPLANSITALADKFLVTQKEVNTLKTQLAALTKLIEAHGERTTEGFIKLVTDTTNGLNDRISQSQREISALKERVAAFESASSSK